ncbi:tRNA uridine-5-carboxymethylaminomethyl(34) synthesis GTPase MnmE [Buchnera aphidicola]|uniref:tRNA uridine-5-carboxymethylaminomethyl(34) synthesis GTPase MnmE n=1 Tax=Buchnera aphidicola TaxID=9 RepID=UPI003464D0C1
MFYDTIVAPCTPYGRSGVGILKISGIHSKRVAYKVLGKIPIPRYAYYSKFIDNLGAVIDSGIALWFPKPNSCTGEDVLELHCHGNPTILDLLIKTILSIHGIRLANPGEFSERSFLNNKIDLIQAESIMDLIHANSEAAVKSSLRSLQGFFSKEINSLILQVNKIRVLVEASINFPEDDTRILDHKITQDINNIFLKLIDINKISNSGFLLQEGVKVSLVGKPNSGKSSIFNALLLDNAAIVTDIEGTTRDILNESFQIDGITFHISDTAGLRSTDNIIEILGIKKTIEQIKLSDHILLVIDDTSEKFKKKKYISDFIKKFILNQRITILFNKSDLSKKKSYIKKSNFGYSCIYLSAKTGSGIEILKNHLKKQALGKNVIPGEIFLARRRHIDILSRVQKKIKNIKKIWMIERNVELLAEDLKSIQNILGEITGKVTSNQILNSIFSTFCIGK